MLSRSLVLGYHACDAEIAQRLVCEGEKQQFSTNAYDWLGSGLYFWEDNHDRAKRWAEDESKRTNSKVKYPAVVGAVIDLGNCLNLIDAEHQALVKEAHTKFLEYCQVAELEVPINKGPELRARYLDKAVINYLHSYRETYREEKVLPAFDSVRAFFVEGEPLYPGAGLRCLDHVQLCIRNPECILGYFYPPRP